MGKRIWGLAVAIAATTLAPPAVATVLTFEDIGIPGQLVPPAAGPGFDELGFHFNFVAEVIDLSGSGPWAAYGPAYGGSYGAINNDGYGTPMSMTKIGGGTFDLSDFYVKSWYGSQSTTIVTGYLNGAVVATLSYGFDAKWSQVVTGFTNVDKVQFNAGDVILLDNVTIADGASAAPEPVAWMAMTCGFALVGAALRRRPTGPRSAA